MPSNHDPKRMSDEFKDRVKDKLMDKAATSVVEWIWSIGALVVLALSALFGYLWEFPTMTILWIVLGLAYLVGGLVCGRSWITSRKMEKWTPSDDLEFSIEPGSSDIRLCDSPAPLDFVVQVLNHGNIGCTVVSYVIDVIEIKGTPVQPPGRGDRDESQVCAYESFPIASLPHLEAKGGRRGFLCNLIIYHDRWSTAGVPPSSTETAFGVKGWVWIVPDKGFYRLKPCHFSATQIARITPATSK